MLRMKIEVWLSDNPGEGDEPIKTEEVNKLVEEMKEKILNLDDRIVIVGMTSTEEV